MVREDECNIIE